MAKTPKPRTRTATKTPRLPSQLKAAIEAARDKKATAITVLDLRKTGAFTDYFLICTGSNPRQVQAIADSVEHALRAVKVRATHVEGYERSEWVLLDYFDFVVHVFSTHARQFYGLERLWGEATRHELAEET
ncbi:MAG TPA: ribosome silencing factor [Vicinamibacterales bacterium]|nr:ribosome silencing factor [Vicinamibacterales bacterium]